MPEDRKTNINNLTIVWQGQSWSVTTPRGEVIYRSINKREAFNFAKNNITHVSEILPANDYLDEHFTEYKNDLKPKTKSRITSESVDETYDFDLYDDNDARGKSRKSSKKSKLEPSYTKSRPKFTTSFPQLFPDIDWGGLLPSLISVSIFLISAVLFFANGGQEAVMNEIANINWTGILVRIVIIGSILLFFFAIFNVILQDIFSGCGLFLVVIAVLAFCNWIGFLPRFVMWLF